MRAVKLREKLDGLRRTVTRVERGPVGANETLKKQVKCLEELIPTVEAREAEERAARRMSAEFTTMAVMAEKSMSPRRGSRSDGDGRWILKSLSLMAEARRRKRRRRRQGKMRRMR